MQDWLVLAIISALITAIVSLAVKFWGKVLSHWFGVLLLALSSGAAVSRNRQANEDYQRTMTATIDALKERITLLEKWRQEAQMLESRISELEEQIRQLRLQGLEKDDAIFHATEELRKVRRELQLKETDITNLLAQLGDERKTVQELKNRLDEAVAVSSDNSLKIGAILHHVTGGQVE